MRVGVIGYLNALPLTYGLPWAVTQAVPSAIQAATLRGEFDLALCSVTTALCHEGLFIVPHLAIACRGAVASVRLVLRPGITAVEQCRRIALDPESNTANRLLQVLLAFYYRVPRETIEWVQPTDSPDAQLIIGDRALTPSSDAERSIDLGAVWSEWTGAPFVFAAWLARTPTIAPELMTTLRSTRDRNLAQLETMVQTLAITVPSAREQLHYLREHIAYDLDADALRGLERFHGYLIELGLAPARPLPMVMVGD